MRLLFLIFFVGFAYCGIAQVPKYKYGIFAGGSGYSVLTAASGTSAQIQSIYSKANFPGMPSGPVKNIYLRRGKNQPAAADTFFDFTVKIGYTTAQNFPNNPNYDTFKTGLTTIFQQAIYSRPATDTLGEWLKMSLSNSSFNYDSTKNFAVTLLIGQSPPMKGFDIMVSSYTGIANRTLVGPHDSLRSKNHNSNAMDLGFDLYTVGVTGISNITSFGLFPNPTTDGRFVVSFETGHGVKDVAIHVTNVTGQVIAQKQYQNVGTSFFKELDIHEVAKGIYFVEVIADGERITRRMQID